MADRDGSAASSILITAVRHFMAGRATEADAECDRLLLLDPKHAEALHLSGMLAMQHGQFERAVDLLTRAVGAAPAFALAHFNLGVALQHLGRNPAAVQAYQRARTLNPQHLETQFNLGNVLAALERFDEAVQAYEQARALNPAIAQVHNNLGNVLAGLGRNGDAIAAYRAAIALSPQNADAFTNLAGALQVQGALAEALEATGEALAIDPAHAAAWFVRSEVKSYTPGDGEIDQLQALIAADDPPRLGNTARTNLEFALSKAWMDVGDADQAFAHLQAANRLKRATLDYDVQDDVRGFDALAKVFDRAFLDRFAGAGDPSDAPIFVLGMPRSGTTLVEQILAAHPDVFGAGELTALMSAIDQEDLPLETLAQRLAGLTPEGFRKLAAGYLAAARPPAVGAAHFTDKMPGNFRFVGLIGLILPNARIVHCVRDPIDTCLSCFTKQFSGRQDFAYDLAELGTFYAAYKRMMAHWRAIMPADRFIEVRYEDVVDDLEAQARRLTAFCGLAWNDACLDFHNTVRPVRTASANQVRKPIYRSSMQRWRPYERHLHALIEAMQES